MQVGAVIPCRTGSKGIPGKNFKMFREKPLWQWSADAAFDSTLFDKIILSTDGGSFTGWTKLESATIDDARPANLSDDKASLDELLKYYAAMYPEIGVWCLLQPTSPLRTADDIKAAWAMFGEQDANGEFRYESLLSAYPHSVFAWIKNAVGIPGDDDNPQPLATYHYAKRPNRQDRNDWLLENGAIYFTRTYILKAFSSRLHGSIAVYEMPQERSIEIDTPYDWFLAEQTARYFNGVG